METNGEQIIKKGTKTANWIKIAYIICILAILIPCLVINYREENETPEAIDFATKSIEGTGESQYAYLNIEGLTSEAAIYGNVENENDSSNDRYYIAISGGYMYIVDLDFDTIEQLKEIQEYTYSIDENMVAPNPVKIYGMTEAVPEELKQYIIDFYNQSVSEEYQITVNEFELYFGTELLNVRKHPVDINMERTIMLLGIIALIVIIILHLSLAIITKRTMKYIKKNGYEEDIAHQLDDFVEEKHYKEKVILTKDYLVDIQQNFTAFKYSDVKWIHVHNLKSYGVLTLTSSIIVYLKDGKTKLQCVEIRGKANEEFLEIFNKICEKIPNDALKGYTQENIKAFKEYQKELKKKKI